MRPALRRAAPLVAALVVCSPLLREPASDTYPLSTYPMFATDRGAIHDIATAVRIDADGTVHRLSPHLIGGTDEVILAAVTVDRAIARGEADELCAEILARLDDGSTVEVRRERVDVVAHVIDDAEPQDVTVHATCGPGT